MSTTITTQPAAAAATTHSAVSSNSNAVHKSAAAMPLAMPLAMSAPLDVLNAAASELPLELALQPKVLLTGDTAPAVLRGWREVVRVWAGRVHWLHLFILTFVPAVAALGLCTTAWVWQTAAFSVLYYFVTGMGITAGYHRLFSHRAYQANFATRLGLLLAGSGALQGSVKWWAGGHRIHHRYTDTPKDPYNSNGQQRQHTRTHAHWLTLCHTTSHRVTSRYIRCVRCLRCLRCLRCVPAWPG
jgi:hypothetical protein